MGCVDGETEYMSPSGWNRIDQYEGGEVAQYDLSKDRIEFVEPTAYHVHPCEMAYHFKHTRGMDQVLTPNHRVLVFKEGRDRKHDVVDAADLVNRVGGLSRAAFLTASVFDGGSGVPLSDDELRVQIAVMADGHFPNGTRRIRINIKKQRKKDRLAELLLRASIEYRRRDRDDGYSEFHFDAPMKCKAFDGQWWNASLHQRRIICDGMSALGWKP